MKSITLREFQRNASAHIKDMIEITQHGYVVGTFIPSIVKTPIPEPQVTPSAPATRAQLEREEKVSTVVDKLYENPIVQPQNRIPCHFCGNRGATLHKYQYEDGSGEGDAFFCDSCWEKYERQHISIGMKPDYSSRIMTPAEMKPTEFRGSFPKPVKKKKGAQ